MRISSGKRASDIRVSSILRNTGKFAEVKNFLQGFYLSSSLLWPEVSSCLLWSN